MRNAIRLNQTRPPRHKHLSNHGFAGRNAPGQPYFQHASSGTDAKKISPPSPANDFQARENSRTRLPRRIFAAFTVLNINMAMVSGPTPPGTGVSAPATSATSGCTSPINVDPFFRNVSSLFAFPAGVPEKKR